MSSIQMEDQDHPIQAGTTIDIVKGIRQNLKDKFTQQEEEFNHKFNESPDQMMV